MSNVDLDSDLLSVLRGTCRNLDCPELHTLLHILDTINDYQRQVHKTLPPILQALYDFAHSEQLLCEIHRRPNSD